MEALFAEPMPTQPEGFAQATPSATVSNLDVCAEFLRVEQELDLFSRRIDDVPFWEYLRFYVFLEMQRSLGLAAHQPFHAGSSWSRWRKRLWSALSAMFLHNPFLTRAKDHFFFGCPRRTRGDDGLWWDTLVDPYLDSLNSYYYIERYGGERHQRPTRTGHVKYFDVLSLFTVGCRLLGRSPKYSPGEAKWLNEVEREVTRRFQIPLDIHGIAQPIWQTRQCLLGLYERLFRKVQPRVVFFASINYPERTAIEVCKRLGIPTVELQHGVIGPFDLCYVFPPKAALHFYPDYLFVWGPFWQQCVDFPLPPERVLATGYPYLEARFQKCADVPKRDQVVILSQPTVGEQLSRFAVALARRSDFSPQVVFRLHPYETNWRERYPCLTEADVTISTSDTGDLYKLLAQSKSQIGAYSAAVLEGLAFGLPTYLVNVPGVEYLQPLLDRGFCRLVEHADEIGSEVLYHALDRDHFFRPNGVANFLHHIQRISPK